MDNVIRREIIDVEGTTTFIIGDFQDINHGHFKKINNKGNAFVGMLQSSPLGKLKLEEIQYDDNGKNYNTIEVTVCQAKTQEILNNYMKNRYYLYFIRKQLNLGTDSGKFFLKTKFCSYEFNTDMKGKYGYLMVGKREYGMALHFWLPASLYSYELVKGKMLDLFPLSSRKGE